MQATTLIDRVKDAFRRTKERVARSHAVHVRRGELALEDLGEHRLLTPPVDIFENESEVLICMDMPGAEPGHTEIHCEEGAALTVFARLKTPAAGRSLYAEFPEDRAWYRAFEVPRYVDAERAHSQMRQGVLRISLPKRERATARRIRAIEPVV